MSTLEAILSLLTLIFGAAGTIYAKHQKKQRAERRDEIRERPADEFMDRFNPDRVRDATAADRSGADRMRATRGTGTDQRERE